MRARSALSPYTPAYDLQQACGTGLQSAHRGGQRHRARQYDSGIAGGVDTTFGRTHRLRRRPAARPARPAPRKSNVDRLKLVGKLPAAVGVEIPTNGEPRTGLSMGEHAAITAKEFGVKRVDQDALAAASHQNMAAAYDRGFFDDLVSPFLACTATTTCAPTRRREAGQAQARLRREERRRHHDGGQLDTLTDGASVALLASEEWGRRRTRLPVLAYFVDGETAAVDYVNGPDGLLMAPTYAVPRLLGAKRVDAAGLRPYEITRRSRRWCSRR